MTWSKADKLPSTNKLNLEMRTKPDLMAKFKRKPYYLEHKEFKDVLKEECEKREEGKDDNDNQERN